MSRREFGGNWWARLWIEALERFGWEDRLRRGRAYARSGEVLSVEIKPGRIEARVRGSRPRPYVVRIAIPQLDDQTWAAAITALAGEARYAAALLDGHMPETVEEIFHQVGAELFPRPGEKVAAECSCPDWADPCKHIAAVHYVVGSELDRDPFLLFRLRGRTREGLIGALRLERSEGSAPDLTDQSDAVCLGSRGDPPLAALLDNYWSPGPLLADLRFQVSGPRVPEAILKRLGSPPAGAAGSLPPAQLARLFRVVSDRAIRTAYEESVGDS